MANSVKDLLEANLFEIFDQRDGTKRRAALERLWSPDGLFADHFGTNVGLAAIDRSVAQLHQKLPGYSFHQRGPALELETAGSMGWGFGPEEHSDRILGTDVIVVADGQIMSLYVFLNNTPADGQ